jgi:hypothetical protein
MSRSRPREFEKPEPGRLALSDILEAGAVLVARNFLVFLRITALLIVPVNLVFIALDLVFGIYSGSGETESVTAWIVIFALVFADLAVLILAGGACLKAAADLYRGERPSTRAALAFICSRLSSFAWLAAISLVAIAPGAVLIFAARPLGRLAPLVFIPLLLSLWLTGIWSVAAPVLLIEEERVGKALARSRSLVRGNYWRALGTVILGSILALFAGFLARVVVSVFPAAGATARAAVVIAGSMAGALVAVPMLAAYLVVLYYDLRVRKEALHLDRAE